MFLPSLCRGFGHLIFVPSTPRVFLFFVVHTDDTSLCNRFSPLARHRGCRSLRCPLSSESKVWRRSAYSFTYSLSPRYLSWFPSRSVQLHFSPRHKVCVLKCKSHCDLICIMHWYDLHDWLHSLKKNLFGLHRSHFVAPFGLCKASVRYSCWFTPTLSFHFLIYTDWISSLFLVHTASAC